MYAFCSHVTSDSRSTIGASSLIFFFSSLFPFKLVAIFLQNEEVEEEEDVYFFVESQLRILSLVAWTSSVFIEARVNRSLVRSRTRRIIRDSLPSSGVHTHGNMSNQAERGI